MLMTLDDVIVHMRKFVIVLVSVDRCLGLVHSYGLLCDSLSTTFTFSQSDMIFSGCEVCEDGLVGGGL